MGYILSFMKCLRLYNIFNLKYDDILIPKIKDNYVLVNVKSTTICRSDFHYYKLGKIGSVKIQKPLILGHEFSGIIVQKGRNVSGIEIGERVAVDPSLSCGTCEYCLNGNPNLCPKVKFCGTPPNNGSLAEYYLAHMDQIIKLPDNISFTEGALLEPLGVAIHSIRLAKIKKNNNIAIIGLGPIGILIYKVLNLNKNISVSGFDILKYRVDFVKKRVNPNSFLLCKSQLKSKKGFKKYLNNFDIVFEAAGTEDAINEALEFAKPGGKIILIGICENDKIMLNSSLYRRKGLTLKGVRRMKNTYPDALELVESKRIEIYDLITHSFELKDGNKAFKLLKNYSDNVIKIEIKT